MEGENSGKEEEVEVEVEVSTEDEIEAPDINGGAKFDETGESPEETEG